MKYLTLLFVLIVSNQLLSQKTPFTFQQFIEQKQESISMPFALKNNAKNKNYLEETRVISESKDSGGYAQDGEFWKGNLYVPI